MEVGADWSGVERSGFVAEQLFAAPREWERSGAEKISFGSEQYFAARAEWSPEQLESGAVY